MIGLARAERFARVGLANVRQRYPNQPAHVWQGPGDGLEPRALHPAFYGSYDWHSCVHMHWMLARLRREFPSLAARAAIDACFDAHLADAPIAGECAYLDRPGTATFERSYGWAWLLKLAGELAIGAAAGDAACQRWRQALAPLAARFVARFCEYLPRADLPIRHGVHANSAFALLLAHDYAMAADDAVFANRVGDKALLWFAGDREAPLTWEPSGADFLSPTLVEADLMRRVLPPLEFAVWFDAFLPAFVHGGAAAQLRAVSVGDRGDPQIVHLDGLNLSRAWSLAGIAASLDAPPCSDRHMRVARDLRVAARHHLDAGAAGLDSTDYAGAHWLATFAVLAEIDGAPGAGPSRPHGAAATTRLLDSPP